MITKRSFGFTAKGEEVFEYQLTDGKMTVCVLTYGCVVNKILVPNAKGEMVDVVLGYDDLAGYENNGGYLGAFIGRVGNRIKDSRFVINGTTYNVVANEGRNCLHGGKEGFDKKIYDAKIDGEKLILSSVSPDGEQGFPGTLNMQVTYSIIDGGLDMSYRAVCDKDTTVSLTNHSYFNLDGEGTILEQELYINSDYITPVDKELIPTGELMVIDSTPFDFTKPTKVGLYIDYPHKQIEFGKGYDHNYVLKNYGKYEAVASLESKKSGIKMEVLTDCLGVQFYAGNCLNNEVGKGGRIHVKHSALCLETQNFPNAINQPSFPNSILKAGEEYVTRTTYKFSVTK